MWDVWIHILEIAAECACWGDGRPSVPPLRQKRGKPGRRAESSRPTKGVAGTCPLIRPLRGHLSLSPLSLRDIIPTPFGLRPFPPDRGNRPLDKGSRPPGGRHDGRVRTPAPTGIVGKNSGRTMCAPTGEGAGTWPLIRPSVRTGAPVPIPSVPSGHLPLTRGVGPQGEGLGKTKRDRFLTCPLKHRGETKFRTKFLCFLSFSKKGSYTGPWRKRSIISWVREMAEPPWGRFSRSNQVPSPSSSS